MRYLEKRIYAVHRIMACIFCTALLSSGLNIISMYLNREQPQPSNAQESEEADAELLAGAAARAAIGVLPLKYLYGKTVLLFVPLILWTLLTILLQDGYIGRIFLIKFIHNSDGEKGKRQILK